MNCVNDSLSNLNNLSIMRSKFLSMSSATIGESRCIEVDQLLTYWFFIFKIWINIFQNLRQCTTGQTPHVLISMSILFTINKVNRASKMLKQPFKYGYFTIVTCENDLVSKIRSVFNFIFLNRKAAFSVYKPCKVSKIILCWKNRLRIS